MRLLISTVLLFVPLLAQDAKPPKAAQVKPLPSEVHWHGDAIDSKIAKYYAEFRIAEYEALVKPLIAERNKLIIDQCEGVGIPEKEIETNCRVDFKASEQSKTGVLQWLPRDKPAEKGGDPNLKIDSKAVKP